MQVNSQSQPQEIFQKRLEIGIPNSLEALKYIINHDKNIQRRKDAIKYLGLFREFSCYETFENLLISDNNLDIKTEAVKALGRLNDKKALKPLKWAIEQDFIDNTVKMYVLRAIASIRFEDPEIELFIHHLNCSDKDIKTCIKNRLINLGPIRLINLIVQSLKEENISEKYEKTLVKLIGYELTISHNDSNVIKRKYPALISTLTENQDFLVELLTSVFEEDDYQLMKSTLMIMELMGDEIYNILISFLDNDEIVIKKNAIVLIGKLHVKEAVNKLIHCLDSIYEEISIATIEALGEIGDLATVPKLLIILDIEANNFEYVDFNLKWYIINAVEKIYHNNKNDAFDHLYYSLNFDNDILKECIIVIMGEIADIEFVDTLVELLKEKNFEVKKMAAIALGKIGEKTTIDPLISILMDKNEYWLLKKVSIDAISNIFHKNRYIISGNDIEAKRYFMMRIERIIHYFKYYNKENYKIKLSVIGFLELYGTETAINALILQINDFYRIVRISSVNAIKTIEKRLKINN